MKTKEEIIRFVESEDFAFAVGGGVVFANDQKTRDEVAQWIKDFDYMKELKVEESAFSEEPEHGTEVYNFYSDNQNWQLQVAYYE